MAISVDFNEFIKDLPVIESPSIYKSGKNFNFDPGGLYSEQIFGPVKPWSCSCSAIKSSLNKGVRCKICGVVCESERMRSTQFAKIELPCYIILPPFVKNLFKMFGQAAIKSIMDKSKRQDNEKSPYYYPVAPIEHKLHKLIGPAAKLEYYKEYPVYDITTLYNLFEHLKNNTNEFDYIKNKRNLDYIFVDYVLVLPVNNRPVIKITDEKVNVHPITKQYVQILKSKKNSFMDLLAQKNSTTHGHNAYNYQNLVNELYDAILQKNFQQKESISRDYMMGKIIEHSGRLVIVPNPILRPYQIGLPQKVIKEINSLELAYFEAKKIDNNSVDDAVVMNTAKQTINLFQTTDTINISDEEFHKFVLENKKSLVYVCERAPVLWKYNVTAFTLGFYTKDHLGEKRNMITSQQAGILGSVFNYRKNKKKVNKRILEKQ